jgi:signal transduction histidine kinase
MANGARRSVGQKPPNDGRPAAARARRAAPRSAGSAAANPDRISALSHQLLHEANSGLPRIDYLARLLESLLEFSGTDGAWLWLKEDAKVIRCDARAGQSASFRYVTLRERDRRRGSAGTSTDGEPLDGSALTLLDSRSRARLPLTPGGSLVSDEVDAPSSPVGRGESAKAPAARRVWSAVLVPILVGDEHIGVVGLTSRRRGSFPPGAAEAYERLAPILGCALVSQRAQAAVHERIKELTCLYGITQLSEKPELGLERIIEGVVRLLPPAWQYPEIAAARIVLDGRPHATEGYRAGVQSQTADVVVNNVRRGAVTVTYLKRRPEIDEGPFLREERSLLDAVARQLALIIERREAAAERLRLEEQLRHADRLATIGQLAAGVAHELNEPLGNVLGFAQLAQKAAARGDAVVTDLEKIAAAALHAREIVKKLMLFARQSPPTKTEVNLNTLISDGLYLVEARCAKQGVEVVKRFKSGLPDIIADASQLQQVLVNLVVNAVQAMPEGGRLTISTDRADGLVLLAVEDTGVGMSDEVKRQIFIPFFTTKDVNEGTGLGLAVVHGIVSAHGGSIKVESEPGRGSRFEVLLPIGGLAAYKETDPDAVFW